MSKFEFHTVENKENYTFRCFLIKSTRLVMGCIVEWLFLNPNSFLKSITYLDKIE